MDKGPKGLSIHSLSHKRCFICPNSIHRTWNQSFGMKYWEGISLRHYYPPFHETKYQQIQGILSYNGQQLSPDIHWWVKRTERKVCLFLEVKSNPIFWPSNNIHSKHFIFWCRINSMLFIWVIHITFHIQSPDGFKHECPSQTRCLRIFFLLFIFTFNLHSFI